MSLEEETARSSPSPKFLKIILIPIQRSVVTPRASFPSLPFRRPRSVAFFLCSTRGLLVCSTGEFIVSAYGDAVLSLTYPEDQSQSSPLDKMRHPPHTSDVCLSMRTFFFSNSLSAFFFEFSFIFLAEGLTPPPPPVSPRFRAPLIFVDTSERRLFFFLWRRDFPPEPINLALSFGDLLL